MNTKRKRSLILLIILLLLAAIYVYRNYIAPQADGTQTVLSQQAQPDDASQADAPLQQALSVYDDEAPPEGEAGEPDGLLTLLDGAAEDAEPDGAPEADAQEAVAIDEDGAYTSRDDVALYIHTYGRLPDNFITKKEAEALGWPGGGLDEYAFGKCIGGSHYGNYEGLLPEKSGRRYTECDIDTMHRSSRGAKRIVFSNDGLIYYTGDHYESFTLLYGEE